MLQNPKPLQNPNNQCHKMKNMYRKTKNNTCHIYTKITTNYAHSNTKWESQSMALTRCNDKGLKYVREFNEQR